MITGFQYRAAKAATKVLAKEMATEISLHQTTLVRFGHTPNMDYLSGHTKSMLALRSFFEKKGIYFPTQNSISLKIIIENSIYKKEAEFLTRFQLICARISTGLTQNELSQHIRISPGTLSILENLENHEFIHSTKIKISHLKTFFECVGISFDSHFTVSLKKDPRTFFIKK